MLDRRSFLITITALSGLALVPGARAAQQMAFSQAAFEEAQKAGRPILVKISAPWCSICTAQDKVLGELLPAATHNKLAVFEVDFDSQKQVVRAFKARKQSTLIAFKGTDEVGRLVGETKAASIKRLLDTTI